MLATLFFSAWEVKPVKDADGKVIGTHAYYAYKAEAGGSIPTFLQNYQGPKTANDSLRGAVKYLREKKAKL